MIIHSDQQFSVCSDGEENRHFTIITKDPREFQEIYGFNVLFESSIHRFVRATLVYWSKAPAKDRFNLSTGIVMRMIVGLDKLYPPDLSSIEKLSDDMIKQHLHAKMIDRLIMISARDTEWLRVPRTQIVMEQHLWPTLADWSVTQVTRDTCKVLGIGQQTMSRVRQHMIWKMEKEGLPLPPLKMWHKRQD